MRRRKEEKEARLRPSSSSSLSCSGDMLPVYWNVINRGRQIQIHKDDEENILLANEIHEKQCLPRHTHTHAHTQTEHNGG